MSGELVGTNNGEWGGQLAWLPFEGEPKILIRRNVAGMEYQSEDEPGAVVFLGLAHLGFDYGFVLKVSRTEDGTWNENELARLTGQPIAWHTIKPGVIAVETHDRVIVISTTEGILGLATCPGSKVH